MEQGKVGRTEIKISAIGLGCVTLGREIDEEISYQVLDYALSKGINWFDSAEAYGGGNARAYRKNVLGIEGEREKTGHRKKYLAAGSRRGKIARRWSSVPKLVVATLQTILTGPCKPAWRDCRRTILIFTNYTLPMKECPLRKVW